MKRKIIVFNPEYSKVLVELRGDKTRVEVAESCKISVSALQMYENGERVPKDEIKAKLANFYRKTIEEIFFTRKSHESCHLASIDEQAATLETA